MTRASSILLYLGLGFATQALGYGDVTFRALASPDATIAVWAHILAWPLFLILLVGYYILWFLAIVLGGCLIFIAYMAIDDLRLARRRAQMRKRRA